MKSALQIDDLALEARLKALLDSPSSPFPPTADEPVSCLGPTYVALRHRGTLLYQDWLQEGELFSTLDAVLTPTLSHHEFRQTDTIELCLTRNYRRVSLRDFDAKFPNSRRGMRGIEFEYQGTRVSYSPTQMIADNLSFKQVWRQFLRQLSLSRQDFRAGGGTIRAFEARQILVSLQPRVTVKMLYRGNQVVSLMGLSRQTLAEMVDSLGGWLLRLPPRPFTDGSPLSQATAGDRSPCQQAMTALSLIRYAQFTGQGEHLNRANLHLPYDLLQDAGIHDEQLSLGDLAATALAILEHPERDRYQDLYAMLCGQIQTRWQADGSFAPRPADNAPMHHNLDAGLALLLWASQYRLQPTPEKLDQCRQSVAYYRAYHLANRHPAFIPWHSQASALLFDATGDAQFREAVFELNDWLLPLQQWDQLRSLDLRGRFYDSTYPNYGRSQAAITGSHLQGLAEAYRLAILSGDATRSTAYEFAIWQGLRYVHQLQFKDEVDLFYVRERSQLQGAVRNSTYDNRIDPDNGAQSLMAVLQVQQLPSFPERVTLPRTAFERLKQGVDTAPLMAEITEKAAFWFHNTSRQQKLMPQQETQSIFLRRAAKPFPPGIDNARDVHASCPTEIAPEFPVVLGWVERFAQEIGGELGRVNIVRLAPQGRVYSHIDYGAYYRLRDRYHLVLQSQSGSWMKAGSEEVVMQEGELWWFDNKQLHEAFNPSQEWRIHLIFDVLPPQPEHSKGEHVPAASER